MKENGNGNGGKKIFSRMVKGGQRTYFINVNESAKGNKYMMLTESKLIEKDKFDYSRVMIFPNKLGEVIEALKEASLVTA
ncbi:MAG: DUF3276 family protein [bacterium]